MKESKNAKSRSKDSSGRVDSDPLGELDSLLDGWDDEHTTDIHINVHAPPKSGPPKGETSKITKIMTAIVVVAVAVVEVLREIGIIKH